VGPVSLVQSQRLKNEFVLDAGKLVPNQLRNTFAVEWESPNDADGLNGRSAVSSAVQLAIIISTDCPREEGALIVVNNPLTIPA
jgi:hypothetical protein